MSVLQVGIAAVQMARAYGLTVYGTAGSAEGLEVVKNCGAHEVFNHREPGYTHEILVRLYLEYLHNLSFPGLLQITVCVIS